MALKMFKGHSIDMNVDPKKIPREKRDEVGRNYFSYKTSEMYYWVMFWGLVIGFLYFLLQAFSDNFFIIPAGIIFFFLIRTHFNYLKAWSKWNKYARKQVVVMDPEKQIPVIVGPKMPWINLKGVRRGI